MGALELVQLAVNLLPVVSQTITSLEAIHAATKDDPAAAALWAQNSAAFGDAADRWAALQAKTA
jgi:hypothetical protein